MVCAVLFDVVGTLLHLREPVGRTYARLAHDFGVERSEAALQRAFVQAFRAMPPMVFPHLGPAAAAEHERRWWRDLVGRTFRESGTSRFGEFDAFFARVFEHFAGAEAWTCAPSARNVLARLRELGLKTGIVSNFDQRLPALLDAFGLRPLLDVVVLPAHAGAAKPDPRIFALALDRLGLPASDVVYVGDDAEQDVRAAAALGMRAIDATRLGDLRNLLERIGVERVE
jgi:putative hydrolase of the HAD superfamily